MSWLNSFHMYPTHQAKLRNLLQKSRKLKGSQEIKARFSFLLET